MNTKSPARFYEALHIYEHVQNDNDDDDDSSDDGAMGGEGSLRSETFIIHAVRDRRFELIRRRSFAGQIKIIHYINLISLYMVAPYSASGRFFNGCFRSALSTKNIWTGIKRFYFRNNFAVNLYKISLIAIIIKSILSLSHKNIMFIYSFSSVIILHINISFLCFLFCIVANCFDSWKQN